MGDLRGRLARLDPLLILAVLAAAAFFAFIYVIDPNRPGLATPEGWFGYFDQGAYLNMANQMADFHLASDAFRYGPVYPALAVPFVWLGLDYDPFAIVNGLALVATIAMTFVVGTRIGGRAVGAIAAFGLLFATPLVGFMAQPWNSTVSIVAVLVVLVVATNDRVGTWSALALGLAPALAFGARYIDGVFVGIIALAVLVIRRREWSVRDLIAMGGSFAIIVCGVLLMQASILGSPFTTPYAFTTRTEQPGVNDQDLGAYSIGMIPRSLFGMFVSPFLLGERFGGASMLQSAFWFLLAVPGVAVAWARAGRIRVTLVTAAAVSLLAVLFYGSFRGGGPGSLQFGSLHYFKAWWPLWALLAALAFMWVARWTPRRTGGPDAPEPER